MLQEFLVYFQMHRDDEFNAMKQRLDQMAAEKAEIMRTLEKLRRVLDDANAIFDERVAHIDMEMYKIAIGEHRQMPTVGYALTMMKNQIAKSSPMFAMIFCNQMQGLQVTRREHWLTIENIRIPEGCRLLSKRQAVESQRTTLKSVMMMHRT